MKHYSILGSTFGVPLFWETAILEPLYGSPRAIKASVPWPHATFAHVALMHSEDVPTVEDLFANPWDNGKENGNYRSYRDSIGVI